MVAQLPGGLRWRLTAWVAAVMMCSVAVIFLVVYNDTGTEVRAQIDQDIVGDTNQLAQALGSRTRLSATQLSDVARSYVQGQPYGATSTLLFVLIPGAGAAFNHPEIVGQGNAEDNDSAADRAHEQQLAADLLRPALGFTVQKVPDIGPTRVLERSVAIGSRNVVIGAGEPLAIVSRAQDGVARTFVLAGAITFA
ncbi:MAG: hypothetical protein ABI323_02955, partial [Solirubrobacteraceae bacterium]